MSDDLILGRLLGRREAFNTVAARCTAAEAALLREMRNQKLYLGHAGDWGQFCAEQLHTSKETANRLIKYLDDFGPAYFDVAQLTRISPKAYRAIAPAIRDQALHHNGEAIALLPENADRVAAAIAELRKAAPPPPPEPPAPEPEPAEDPIRKLARLSAALVSEFEGAIDLRLYRERIRAEIGYLRTRIDRLELTL